MRVFPWVFLLLIQPCTFSTVASAQAFYSFQPSRYSVNNAAEFNKKLEVAYHANIAGLPENYRSELQKIYKSKYESLTTKVKEEHFIFDSPLNRYVDRVLAEIIRANPSLSGQDIRLLISRSSEPNASCVGNGILTLNIGMTRRFENESQLAFVVCHELAHHLLNHVDLGLRQYAEKMYGQSTKKDIGRIADSDTRRVEKATELLRGIVYENNRHSRVHEASADSLAYVLMRNSPYNELETLNVLALFDTVDTEKYRYPLQLKEFFDTPHYPFQESWLQASSLGKMEYQDREDWNKDSLKTHPDCSKRILKVKGLLPSPANAATLPKKPAFVQTESAFSEIVRLSDFEIIEREYQFKNYDKCLLQSILLIRKYPASPYLHAAIGKCFYRLYEAQKNHQLGKCIAMPAPGQTAAYRQMLDFIHHLRLKDVSQLGYYYLKKDQPAYVKDEDFLFALTQLSKAANAGEDAKTLQNEYLKLFPKGKYVSEIKQQ